MNYDWLLYGFIGALIGLAGGWAAGWRMGVEDFKLQLWMDFTRMGRMTIFDTKGHIKTLVQVHDSKEEGRPKASNNGDAADS